MENYMQNYFHLCTIDWHFSNKNIELHTNVTSLTDENFKVDNCVESWIGIRQ
jgi:hypothetical protein